MSDMEPIGVSCLLALIGTRSGGQRRLLTVAGTKLSVAFLLEFFLLLLLRPQRLSNFIIRGPKISSDFFFPVASSMERNQFPSAAKRIKSLIISGHDISVREIDDRLAASVCSPAS